MSILRAFNTGVSMNRAEQLAAKKLEYEGKIYPTNRCGDVVVVEYINSRKVLIRFLNTNNEKFVGTSELKEGLIKDKAQITTCNYGIIDIDGASIGKTMTKEYRLWNGMINRCYNEKYLMKYPSYAKCSVDERWKYLSAFKEWCNNQIGFEQEGWTLDKDILIKGNKVYSPETCCFVPAEINTLILKADRIRGKYPIGVYHDTSKCHKRFSARVSKNGKHKRFGSYLTPEEVFYVYKREKELHIKEVANKWKDQIDPRVYEALMNWTIEITD